MTRRPHSAVKRNFESRAMPAYEEPPARLVGYYYPIKLHLPKNYEPVQNEIPTNEGGQSYTITENHKFKVIWKKKNKTVIPDTSVR